MGALIILAVVVVGFLVAINHKPKRSTCDAEWSRNSEQLDWVIRGGTHDGYNLQNTPMRNPKTNWKPGIRIVK